MKLVIPKGATSRIVTVFIQANNVTTGAGLAGLTSASSIVGGYVREGGLGVALAVDEDVTTEGTYQAPSTAAHVRIGTPANLPAGFYELHFHNDLWATGAEAVSIGLAGAANMAPLTLEVQLSDPKRGLGAPTALPNADADAAGGLPISDAGGLDLDAQKADVAAILVDTADIQPKIGAPAGASVSADVAAVKAQTAAIEADTQDLQTQVGVDGAGLTAIGDARLANLDAAVSSRASAAQATAIEADTQDLQTQVGVDGAGLTAIGDLRLANLDATVSSRATAASIAALASDLALILGHVDTEVAAILQDTDVSIPGLIAALETLIDAVKAKTDLIPAAPAAVSDIPTAVQNADALLGRSIAGGANGGRTVQSAFRRLRNRVAIAGGTLSVYQENDSTVDHTAAVTTAAGNPVTEVDPA